MDTPDHMPADIEKAAEELKVERNREALIRELGLIQGSPDADITRELDRRNRRQMKLQFGLVDEKLKDMRLTRNTATAQQFEAAMNAVTDDELNAVLAKERARTEEIMNEERRRGHVPGY